VRRFTTGWSKPVVDEVWQLVNPKYVDPHLTLLTGKLDRVS